MNNELNVNSGKKVVILVSVIFSIIIVLIGVTSAYFTQGAGANIENIVTTDELSLEYNDDVNNYMRQELIPSTRNNAITAYNRTEEGKKCLDMNDRSACSIYRFSVKNTSNVSQLLKMSLHPTANSYKNLKFMLYEVAEDGNMLIKDATNLIQFSVEPITMSESYTLGITNEDNEKTFEVVFYIEAKDYDQTGEDASKQFGAGIRIDSITSGKYIAEGFGPNCWETEEKDRTKLVKFNGINHDTGEIDEMCTGYVSQNEYGYYSVNIPSNVGGQEITILGRDLFNALVGVDEENFNFIFNKYKYIETIIMDEGIKEIENGENPIGTFLGVGALIVEENFNLNIKLPESLVKIGDWSFVGTTLKSIRIPKNVEIIGAYSFMGDQNGIFPSVLKEVMFDGIDDGTSKLKTIGEGSFLLQSFESIRIPSSVETIGERAFIFNENLTTVTFESDSQLQTIGDSAFSGSGLTSINIPSKVTSIGSGAFSYNSNLTTVTFGSDSQLQTIGNSAFYESGLTSINIPSKVTSIGYNAFFNNSNLTTVTFGSDSQLQTIGNSAFYESGLTSINIPSKVTSIGYNAFYNNSNLTTVTFMGSLDGTSKLQTMGWRAFSGCNLMYKTKEEPLILPSSITTISEYAFAGNFNLDFIYFTGNTAGFHPSWLGDSNAEIVTTLPEVIE